MDNQPSDLFDDSPSLLGPDYVAVVIEWDEPEDKTTRTVIKPAINHRARTITATAAALGAVALAAWGIHRLRAA